MEARTREQLPTGEWAYEPKWDGFRCHAWAPGAAGGDEPALYSRAQRPLRRYFPELDAALAALPPGTVVDGEVVVAVGGTLDFDALQQRIHPAESRIAKLSAETPAQLIAFDLLADAGADLRAEAFAERRRRLERVAAALAPPWRLTPSTTDPDTARRWFTELEAAGCDGIVAKRLDGPYRGGERDMVKVKHRRTVDCVVGGYRLHKDGDKVGSLLLGLYTAGGDLHFIGHCSGFSDAQRAALLEQLQPLVVAEDEAGAAGGFGERARRPGEPSRWTGDKDLSWIALAPQLVCEVSYDQLAGERFRHATRFERWRPDKEPRDCRLDQLERPSFGPSRPSFDDVVG
jgi:ATP-dependent DNA ligase